MRGFDSTANILLTSNAPLEMDKVEKDAVNKAFREVEATPVVHIFGAGLAHQVDNTTDEIGFSDELHLEFNC